jgi:hypothetical protein
VNENVCPSSVDKFSCCDTALSSESTLGHLLFRLLLCDVSQVLHYNTLITITSVIKQGRTMNFNKSNF